MGAKEQIQENQYSFPYHHLTHEQDGEIYIFRHLFWGLEHLTYIKYVIEEVIKHQPATLVDIGCGEGRIISEIKKKYTPSLIHGYDISPSAVRFAKAFVPDVEFETHNIVKTPLPTKFDTAVSCEVIEHIKPEEVELYCKNIAESLTKGGALFLTTPTTNIPVISKHYQHFTKEKIEEYLSPYFNIEKVTYLNVINWYSSILNKVIANRLFLSNCKRLNKWVLSEYRKKLLNGNKKNGSRIFVKAVKK